MTVDFDQNDADEALVFCSTKQMEMLLLLIPYTSLAISSTSMVIDISGAEDTMWTQ